MLHVVILAGGSGTRFWPKSRAARPKQLLAIGGEQSLLVETVDRVAGLVPAERVWVVTNARYADQVRAQLPEVPADQVVAEPAGRDTAAAIGLGTLLVQRKDPDADVVVLPADQRIEPHARFTQALSATRQILARDPRRIVVFGVRPSEAATGYGYIERAATLEVIDDLPLHDVASFREKPDQQTAQSFVDSGRFFWNAGIFGYRASFMLQCIAEHLPALHGELTELIGYAGGADWERELAERYPRMEKISIDYGVMERCPHRVVVETDFDWDDVGSWAALERNVSADADGNHSVGALVAVESSGNIVDAGGGLVALLGVKDLVVVQSDDVTMVCPKERAEEVKALLARVQDREELQRYL